MSDDALLIRPAKPERQVEICRSFAYKLNIPGQYESRDFFCSQKTTCNESEAEDLSERLYIFCRSQVLKDVAAYQRDRAEQAKRQKERGQTGAA